MKFILYLKSKLTFYVALSLTFILASCGSYQYVGYDNDGIYGSDEIVYENSYRETPNSNNSYYKNYFDEKSRQFENLSEDGDIFTDIDSYQGDYEEVEDSTYVSGYSGWGQDNTDVTINVYSNYGYSNWWYRPYAWNWYRPYYGWDFYWNDPFWFSPFNYGYGGFYGGFGFYSPFYGSYWNYGPYWNGFNRNRFYYNGYYGSRNIAYNAGRRGSTSNYSTNRTSSLYNRASSLNRRSSSNIYNDNTFTRSRNSINSTTDRRRNFQNSSSSRNFRSITTPRTNNLSRPRVNNSSRPNVNNRSYSTPSRSNNSNSFNRSSSGSSGSSTRSFSSGSSNRSSSGNSSVRSSSGNNGSRSSSGSRRSNQ